MFSTAVQQLTNTCPTGSDYLASNTVPIKFVQPFHLSFTPHVCLGRVCQLSLSKGREKAMVFLCSRARVYIQFTKSHEPLYPINLALPFQEKSPCVHYLRDMVKWLWIPTTISTLSENHPRAKTPEPVWTSASLSRSQWHMPLNSVWVTWPCGALSLVLLEQSN